MRDKYIEIKKKQFERVKNGNMLTGIKKSIYGDKRRTGRDREERSK